MNELALFAGAGGGILGGVLLGWRTVCAVEIDPYARQVLLARQRDGILEPFPIWDDATTFDGNPWRGKVQVISAGWPCTEISAAGTGEGLDGKKSGLWSEVARTIFEVQPQWCLLENSPLLVSRGLDRVLSDLAALGYDAAWGVIGAHHMGHQHRRDRIWIVAHTNSHPQHQRMGVSAGEIREQRKAQKRGENWIEFLVASGDASPCKWRHPAQGVEPRSVMWGSGDGMADQLDRLRCVGNGQVPAVAAFAFRYLSARLMEGIESD